MLSGERQSALSPPRAAVPWPAMSKRANIKRASDLSPETLRRMLLETERAAGADSPSAGALRRALAQAERRAADHQEKDRG